MGRGTVRSSFLLGAGFAVVGVSLAGAPQDPEFRAGTHTVSVYATVVGADGRLATDLSGADFEVYDDGVRQEITLFSPDPQPITIVAMLDRSGSVRDHFGLVRDATEEFILNLRPEDRARLGSFSQRIELDPETFTSDRQTLLDILDGNLQDSGPTPLWNAAAVALDALRGEEGRRVVVIFTDGRDTPGAGENATFEEIRDRSEAEEVMVYAIGLATNRCGTAFNPRGPALPGGVTFQIQGGRIRRPRGGFPGQGGPRPRLPRTLPPRPRVPVPAPTGPTPPLSVPCTVSEPDPDLRELAAVGGGGYFELDNTDDLRSTFARVADELHQQYLLGFTPTTLDDRIHRIEVRVRQSGVQVRARQSYLAASMGAD